MALRSCYTLCLQHSHYHHYADLLTCIEHIWLKILEACINACWIYSAQSVSNMSLFLSVTFLILFASYRVVCVKLAHSSLGDREDIFITHLIITITIGSIKLSHCCHIFSWLCARYRSTIICCRFHINPGKIWAVPGGRLGWIVDVFCKNNYTLF